MKNKLAEDFVNDLIGTFTSRTSEETRNTFTWRASDYQLSAGQWKTILRRLMDSNLSGYIIPWPLVEEEIKKELNSRKNTDMGWKFFMIDGHGYRVRVKYENGRWINSSLRYKDVEGNWHELGYRIGQEFRLPDGAVDERTEPDNPADPDPREMLTEKEKQEFFTKIRSNLAQIKSMPNDVPF